jgi:methyl-accepting chemotaxis protein
MNLQPLKSRLLAYLPMLLPPDATAPRSANTVALLRLRGVVGIAVLGWVSLAAVILTSFCLDSGSLMPLLVVGVVVNLAPTAMAVRGRYDAEARMVVGTVAAVMPALLVYVLRGHPWQMDGHMYFFVALAGLTVLCDWRPLAVASLMIAVHHLLFEWIAPEWVFTGSGNLGRIIFHAAAVFLQFCVLGYLAVCLAILFDRQDAAVAEGQRLVAEADKALNDAQAAFKERAAERARREAAEQRFAVQRRAEMQILANEFDRTVSNVVNSLEGAASNLASSSTKLSDVAGDARREADDVASSAAQANDQIRNVASAIRNLGTSIGAIAATSQQQSSSTKAADLEGRQSVETITQLFDKTEGIASFVDTIKAIANKTNLLALNATIEAARTGEAGQGFAVVAGEIKHLAKDAERASDKVSILLQGIQAAVAESSAGIENVSSSVREVAEGAGNIADAVEDQRNYVSLMANSASDAEAQADAIEHRIQLVASAVSAASILSIDVHKSAGALSESAGALRQSANQFVKFLLEEHVGTRRAFANDTFDLAPSTAKRL